MAKNKNAAAVARCRAKCKRVELLLTQDEYAALKETAYAAGETVAGFTKRVLKYVTTATLDLTELDKLERLLRDAGIPYERDDTPSDGRENHIICYPSKGEIKADAIISFCSIGRERGLLEQTGLLPPWEKDSVEGYLTAESVFRRWRDDFED